MAKLPLEGIRVLDLTRAVAGTTGTLFWPFLGAELIKVEAIQRPDMPTREMQFAENDPGDQPWNRGGYFHRLNMGKMGITLDLVNPKAAEIFKRLVAVSDVVAENYSPRAMKNFGLDYPVLSAINPGIIMVSMSGFGATGPRKDWVAYAGVMESAGLTSITGYPDGMPMASAVAHGDWSTGAAGAAALLTALYYREKSGKGQHIDVSGREAIVSFLGEKVLEYTMNGRVPTRQANRHAWKAPHGCYPCQGDDSWVTIVVSNDEEWNAFCKAIGGPAWTKDEKFADGLSRWKNQEELNRLIGGWTCQRDHNEAAKILLEASVPAAPVADPKEVMMDPHLRERNFYEIIDQPVVGTRVFPKQLPAHYSVTGVAKLRPAPLLGQHNHEVLGGILGMSEAEIRQLEEEPVLGTEPIRTVRAKPSPMPLDAMKAGGVQVDDDYLEQLGRFHGVKMGPHD
ncbi:MAG: CoA transferase [Chloroflexi bacterium]|nr:CoA transferase [Chloroflexota bacterium]